MNDIVGTIFLLLTGFALGVLATRILWLMSIEEGDSEE